MLVKLKTNEERGDRSNKYTKTKTKKKRIQVRFKSKYDVFLS